MRECVFEARSDVGYFNYVCGKRESPYENDGTTGVMVDFGLISFYPTTNVGENFDVVLVVDDNKMNLKVVEALLKRSKIQLDFATGGNECFSMTKEKKYDLIFMDHMMPEPDGVQTLHMIREDRDNENLSTPVVVLTANAIEGMREQYLSEGFDNFLSKPINFVELEKILEEYLRRS